MQIVIAPNPVLRRECDDIVIADEDNLEDLAADMAQTMYDAGGCGLAAPQVGIAKKLIVVDVEYDGGNKKRPIVLVNPVVQSTQGEVVIDEEGCLSIPGMNIQVARKENAVVTALDIDGQPVTYEATGFFARCLQHEIDHLHGVTLFEKLPVLERIEALEEFRRMQAAGQHAQA